MPSAEYDLRYIRAGVDALEDFLLSSDIYWPVGASAPTGEPTYPQLTLGGMLLARARLEAGSLSNEQYVELANLEELMDTARTRWRVAWEGKTAKEFSARLNLWRNFLNEYRESPENNADRYPYEVTRRVQLHLLGLEAAVEPAQMDMLKGLDRLLQAVFLPGEFIWEPGLERAFPKNPYWYLYGRIRKGE